MFAVKDAYLSFQTDDKGSRGRERDEPPRAPPVVHHDADDLRSEDVGESAPDLLTLLTRAAVYGWGNEQVQHSREAQQRRDRGQSTPPPVEHYCACARWPLGPRFPAQVAPGTIDKALEQTARQSKVKQCRDIACMEEGEYDVVEDVRIRFEEGQQHGDKWGRAAAGRAIDGGGGVERAASDAAAGQSESYILKGVVAKTSFRCNVELCETAMKKMVVASIFEWLRRAQTIGSVHCGAICLGRARGASYPADQ